MIGILIGRVDSYDPATRTAKVVLTSRTRRGDRLHILGPDTDVELRLRKLHCHGLSAIGASKGDEVVISSPTEVREGDDVFRLIGSSLSDLSSFRAASS